MKTIKALSSLLQIATLSFASAMPVLAEKTSAAYQKPGAPVRLSNPEIIELALGKSTLIPVSFYSGHKKGQMQVKVLASQGLSSPDFGKEFFFDLESDEAETSIELLADRVGRYSLKFYVELDGKSRVLVRSVYAGGYDQWKIEKMLNWEDKKVSSMPAKENIQSTPAK